MYFIVIIKQKTVYNNHTPLLSIDTVRDRAEDLILAFN